MVLLDRHDQLVHPADGDLGQPQLTEPCNDPRAEASAALERAGRLIAEPNRRGWTFAQIEERFGISDATANRWARPFL